MNLLDPTILRDSVDYSFGDQSGVHTINGYMRVANSSNHEFISLCNEIKLKKNWMSLFIDNFRLYKSEELRLTKSEMLNEYSKYFKEQRIKELENQDLLSFLSEIPEINFIIFTGFEDTPLNKEIFSKIPENVIGIYSSNSIEFGGKVVPIPYGLQRKLTFDDYRHEIIYEMISSDISPTNLLYMNHRITSNPHREVINNYFSGKDWAKVDSPNSTNSIDYKNYLTNIKKHKFMVCPDGNAIGCECSRDWEVIYMRRVPIVVDSEYLRYIFKNIPVLFVKSFLDITEDLLVQNDYLYNEMQDFNLSSLDMKKIYENILNQNNLC
jgi:hypothetical protein